MTHAKSSQSGMSLIIVLVYILLFLGLLLGIDYGYIYFSELCGDTPIGTCFTESPKKSQNQFSNQKETPVTATGSFTYKTYSVTVSMTFPMEGGFVSGTVDGDCKGKVSGTYKGGSFGPISGTIYGSCSPFFVPIPAKATFEGAVNQENNTVPINGTGGAAGFSGSGSITLTY
jgi:hypothetical protein